MYQLPELNAFPGLQHAFSDLSEGNMAFNWGEPDTVLRNRRELFKKLGTVPEKAVAMYIDHGTRAIEVGPQERGRGMLEPQSGIFADALITRRPDVFLFLLTGDCLPVVLYSTDTPLLALVHLGWKNINKSFPRRVVDLLKERYGIDPASIWVGIGPCIRAQSYVFTEDEVRVREIDWPAHLHKTPDGRVGIDLVGRVIDQFCSAGIRLERIFLDPHDTGSDPNLFSHYRSRKNGEPEGRIATVVGLVSG